MNRIGAFAGELVIRLIKGYQWLISPLFYGHCRFHPTCSQYAITAVEQYGALKGIWLTFSRLLRCHPLNAGGYDPVPVPDASINLPTNQAFK